MLTPTDLQAYLTTHAIAGEIVHLAEPTPTVEISARVVGVPVDAIVKSILFMAADQPVLVVANGLNRVDAKAVADYLQVPRKQVKMANPETVLAVTGYPVGTVPPLGHPAPLRTLLEVRVLEQPSVFAGGGGHSALLRIAPAEIQRVTRAEMVQVVKSD